MTVAHPEIAFPADKNFKNCIEVLDRLLASMKSEAEAGKQLEQELLKTISDLEPLLQENDLLYSPLTRKETSDMLHQKVSVLEEELKKTKNSLAASQSKLEKLEAEHDSSMDQLVSDVDHYRDLYEGLKSTVKNSEK